MRADGVMAGTFVECFRSLARAGESRIRGPNLRG